MRVALDLSAVTEGSTGVAKWGEELWSQLVRNHPEVTVVPFAFGRGPYGRQIDMRRIRVPLRVARRAWKVVPWPPIERWVGPADLLHVIDGSPPPTRAPLILTIHDVLPLRLPDLYGEHWIRVLQALIDAAQRADLILTHCQATADDISDVGGIPRDRIAVALPGHRPPSPVAPPSLVEGPFLLAVGAVTPRKGFEVLAEAAARLGASCPPIVIAGPDFWRADEVRARIEEVGMTDRVTFLGRVGDDELEGLYRAATLMCHPSIAEGFGIPFLEGMGFGAPVVAADIPPCGRSGWGRPSWFRPVTRMPWPPSSSTCSATTPLGGTWPAAATSGRRPTRGRRWPTAWSPPTARWPPDRRRPEGW